MDQRVMWGQSKRHKVMNHMVVTLDYPDITLKHING